MSTTNGLRIATIVILAVTAAACAGNASTVPSPTAPFSAITGPSSSTPDPCTPGNLPGSVEVLNEYMRQFDSHAALASNIAQSQVRLVIPPMQEIRRGAQTLAVGACLANLKRLQLQYMDTTLQTLQAFQAPTPDASAIASGILQARNYHDEYTLEMAHLLGVTLSPLAGTPTP